jgi:hypothetical protein
MQWRRAQKLQRRPEPLPEYEAGSNDPSRWRRKADAFRTRGRHDLAERCELVAACLDLNIHSLGPSQQSRGAQWRRFLGRLFH